MSLINIEEWHRRARRDPSGDDFRVQFGCHLEEIVEMLECVKFYTKSGDFVDHTYLMQELENFATSLKTDHLSAGIDDRESFLDSIADQVVTGVGAAYCAHMKPVEAIRRVDESNWTKFKNGLPAFNENGKIIKPDTYKEPNLYGCY